MASGGAGRARPARLERVGALVAARPRTVVAVWAALVAVLAIMGLGVDGKLVARVPVVAGSVSQREHDLVLREFGRDNALVVLLKGPAGAVERQGRLLERRLDSMPGATVISPWDSGGAIRGLMPSPGVAGVVVSIKSTSSDPTTVLPPLRHRIDATVRAPVHASVAGAPAIGESFLDATRQAAADGERIAIPLLLIVLLLVFRSVGAAAVPVLIGGAVVASARGILDLILRFSSIDVLALGALGMMGLALGVDYSLLVVSRYREEVEKGAEPAEAVRRTVGATGPTVITAGAGLSLAMLVCSQLLPGGLVSSVSIAVISAALLSVLSALLVVPAMLMLLGPRLERWSLPRRAGGGGLALKLTSGLSRRPRLVVWPVIAALAIVALLAFTLDTRVEAVGLLPAGDSGRRQQEEVQRELGPGWVAPYEVVMQGGDEPVTTPDRLRALADFQRRVEADPGVATMAGFAGIERATRKLGDLGKSLAAQQRGLGRLGHGLSRVHDGAALNTSGLLQAADGARRLGTALSATQGGAGLLARGLGAASSGSDRLSGGIDRASGGSGALASGATKASQGAGRLTAALGRAREKTGELTGSAGLIENAMTSGSRRVAELEGSLRAVEARLAAELTALEAMTTGRGDPRYAAALEATQEAIAELTGTDPRNGEATASSPGAATGAARAGGQFSLGLYLAKRLGKSGRKAADGIGKLARGSERLDRGLGKLATGSRKLSEGMARLAAGGKALPPGLARLSRGAEGLADGLGQIETGAGGLAGGLGGGAQKSKLLTGALGKIAGGVERQRNDAGPAAALRQRSPGLFRSGYFYLASIDGSGPERRTRAGFLISLDRGGRAARMLVVPREAPSEAGAAETRDRLEGDAAQLARSTGTAVVVGGATPDQLDLNGAFRDQSGPARLALALITILILIPVMRSLIVPLIAALLNVLTVAATFGFLAILFNGSLLGGPGYVDSSVIPVTIVVIFGLAIDYEVFIFARMREEYVRSGSAEAAIVNGLERTAPVITGAALIMVMIFLAFATSSFATLRAFGVAQAIAVAIDAFFVRLVVVPTLMRALGKWAWWLPGWLDRLLPGGSPVRREGAAA